MIMIFMILNGIFTGLASKALGSCLRSIWVKLPMSFAMSFAVDKSCAFVCWTEYSGSIYGTTVHLTHLADLQQLEPQPQIYLHSDCLVWLIVYEICSMSP